MCKEHLLYIDSVGLLYTYCVPGLVKHIPCANSHSLLSNRLLPPHTPLYLPQGFLLPTA